MIKKTLLFFALILLLSSCASRKKIVYFQNISEMSQNTSLNYEPILKSDDLLMIIVSAPEAEAALPFNLPIVGVMGSNGSLDIANTQMQLQTYLIDNMGFVQFPVLGKIKLSGLTRVQAMEKLYGELVKYIKDPIINIRIMNYKISVIGEVTRPGSFNIPSERVTLLEAISNAGDLTIYGSRNNILIIREVDGQKKYNFVDITKADFINSPFYYLSQNDVVYVEPNKTKVNSSAIGPNATLIISGASLFVTLIALLIR